VRRALVTGAARGIGAAIAKRLADDGFEVLTADRDEGCDLRFDVASDAIPDLGEIDVCVSNAAITDTIAPAHRMSPEQWQRDLDVNLTGTFRVIQACLPGMRERRFGRVVVISSTAAVHGMPAQVSYSTSKAGLLGMTKTIAAENAAHGITANVVLPGMTASAAMLAMPEDIKDAWLKRMPMGAFVHTEDIAEAVAFFATPAAGRVTGQELTVDGGHALNTLSVTGSAASG